jgi:tetratricopeptide (TPR) repeat protein
MKQVLLFILMAATWSCFAQDQRLAENYMDQGEYRKALSIYDKLYNANKRSVNNLFNLIEVLHQLERYESVDSILDNSQKIMPNNKQLLIEKGYNASLQGKDSIATDYYQRAIAALDSLPQLTYQIAMRFEQRSLLNEAVQSYEKGQELRPEAAANFSIQLARLYGEQGELKKMFESYLVIISENDQYRYRAQAIFSQYVTDDPDNEGNQILRKVLLTQLRDAPDPIYNKLLSWLFVQQKDFKKAFAQEKAIYKRNPEGIGNLMQLVFSAVEEQDITAAKEILDYVITESQSDYVKYSASVMRAKISADYATVDEYPTINTTYEALLAQYGDQQNTYALQLDYADFLAFKYDQVDQAVAMLSRLEKLKLNPVQKAQVKMKLADILVLQEQFNRALILYSQIQNDVPNNELAQESQFKVARTSYYQGDFPWSLTQLKVLRSAASKLIANDAMALSLTISDHSQEDTTFVALKAFAKADLKQYQNKTKEAIKLYDEILLQHKGDPIEDEALFNQARLYESQANFEQAAQNYQVLIDNYSDGILADDAYYRLGLLYEERLAAPEKAQPLYERIIYDHGDSIHLIDARRRYRRLRGDTTTTDF